MRHRYLLFVILLLACKVSYAQQDKVVIRFVDAQSNAVLNKVSVIDKSGSRISGTDTAGYAVFSLAQLRQSGYLLALCPGYKPDTVRNTNAVVYMQPLQITLKDAIVRSSKVSRLLHEPNECLVDYDFVGDNILAATYSGSNDHHAKLFMINKEGEELAKCNLPAEPLGLYRSCVGIPYCICGERFYPLIIDSNKITLRAPYNKQLLAGLQQCELSVKGNLYYRLADRANFAVKYGMIAKGDSAFKPIKSFEEDDVAQASWDEWQEILDLLSVVTPANRSAAARKQLARLKWDRGSFAHINMLLIVTNDTLAIFDFFKKKILLYDLEGIPAGSVPIRFEWRQSQQFAVVTDEAIGKVYIHRYGGQGVQTIEELDVRTGTTSSVKTLIERPFAEDVKVHNGDIYFLWQDKTATATRQLFIQRAGDDIAIK